MSFRIEGLDQVTRKLKDLEAKARRLHGTHQVPAHELLTHDFMRRHTRFGSFAELVVASGFKGSTAEEFAAIPDDEWDAFIKRATTYSSWHALLQAAAAEWTSRELGLR
jgi:hypothetical protein